MISLWYQNGRDEFYLSGFTDSKIHRERDCLFGIGGVEIEVIVMIKYKTEGKTDQQRKYPERFL